MTHCATSLDEFSAGQHVRVVFGASDLRPGVVERVLAKVVRVRLADHSLAYCQPYAVVVDVTPIPSGEPVGLVQDELFERAELLRRGTTEKPGVRQ